MSKRKKPDYPRGQYVQRKVDHMNRMGIAAKINEFGAAEPQWRTEQRKKEKPRDSSSS